MEGIYDSGEFGTLFIFWWILGWYHSWSTDMEKEATRQIGPLSTLVAERRAPDPQATGSWVTWLRETTGLGKAWSFDHGLESGGFVEKNVCQLTNHCACASLCAGRLQTVDIIRVRYFTYAYETMRYFRAVYLHQTLP